MTEQVELVGGPRDGERYAARGNEQAVQFGTLTPVPGVRHLPSGKPMQILKTATYTRDPANPRRFVYQPPT
jgi:hypothetical protein